MSTSKNLPASSALDSHTTKAIKNSTPTIFSERAPDHRHRDLEVAINRPSDKLDRLTQKLEESERVLASLKSWALNYIKENTESLGILSLEKLEQ